MACSEIAYPTRRVINYIIETYFWLFSLYLIYFHDTFSLKRVNMSCSYDKYKYKIEGEYYNIIPISATTKIYLTDKMPC